MATTKSSTIRWRLICSKTWERSGSSLCKRERLFSTSCPSPPGCVPRRAARERLLDLLPFLDLPALLPRFDGFDAPAALVGLTGLGAAAAGAADPEAAPAGAPCFPCAAAAAVDDDDDDEPEGAMAGGAVLVDERAAGAAAAMGGDDAEPAPGSDAGTRLCALDAVEDDGAWT